MVCRELRGWLRAPSVVWGHSLHMPHNVRCDPWFRSSCLASIRFLVFFQGWIRLLGGLSEDPGWFLSLVLWGPPTCRHAWSGLLRPQAHHGRGSRGSPWGKGSSCCLATRAEQPSWLLAIRHLCLFLLGFWTLIPLIPPAGWLFVGVAAPQVPPRTRIRVGARYHPWGSAYSVCLLGTSPFPSCNVHRGRIVGGTLASSVRLGADARGFCDIASSGLWSETTFTRLPYVYWWKHSTPKMIANSSFSISA